MVSILRSHSGAWSGYNIVGRPPLAAPVVATAAAIAISGGCCAGGRESSRGNKAVGRPSLRRTQPAFPPVSPPGGSTSPLSLSRQQRLYHHLSGESVS